MSNSIVQKPNRFLQIIMAISGAVALILLVTALAGCGSESASLATDTGGRLQLAQTSFDFGSVPVNQQVEHEYGIKNVGSGTLQLGQPLVKRLEGC
ncbi:MAG: hypothetical protein ACYC5F_02910 [Thermoleophilia bacterium]